MRILPRLRTSDGQGTLAIVVAMIAIGGMAAAAVPAYLGFQDRKAEKTAKAQLLTAVWTVEAYRQDHHGSYAGMDTVSLRKIDPRLPAAVVVTMARHGGYCLADDVHGRLWSISGPVKGNAKFAANADCA
jgi:type II secretory pathway pseudopilin PulG